MISPHLQAEQARLESEIERLRRSGAVAPPNVWIGPNFQTKGGKTYEYYKLGSENPRVKHQHLGQVGSRKYQEWSARITRRNILQELERQRALLEALTQRQERVGVEVLLDKLVSCWL